MRSHRHSAIGLIFGTGLAFSGATASIACGTKLDNCETTSTCSAPRNTGGSGGSHAEAGAPADEGGGSGGKGGHGGTSSAGNQGGKGGGGGSSDTSTRAGSPGEGVAGSDDVAPHDDDHQHGDVHHGDGGESGEGGEGGTPSDVPASGGGRSGSPGHASAGQGNSAGAGSGGTSGQGADTTPPSVTSVSPPNGASGVTSDTDIVLTFSEPMDTLSVQAAYQSNDLPPASVEFSWKNDSTQLVIHPKSPLAYADVTDLGSAAKHYAYALANSATDLAGNHLAKNAAYDGGLGFTTLRHVTQTLADTGNVYVGEYLQDGSERLQNLDCATRPTLTVGKVQTFMPYPLFQFDISALPAGIVAWQSVLFTSSHAIPFKNPYLDGNMGKLHLFGTTIDPNTLGWGSPVTDLGVIADYSTADSMSLDVKLALADDYAHRDARGGVSEYVLKFEHPTFDAEDQSVTKVDCNAQLKLDYLVP